MPRDDAEALGGAIVRLLEDDDAAAASDASRERALTFDVRRVAARHEQRCTRRCQGQLIVRLHVVVTGLVAQHPDLGGMTWHYLQYVLGLALGHDVFYLEDSGEWPYRWDGGEDGDDWVEPEPSRNVEYLASVMERFGLADRWAYRVASNGEWYGASDDFRRSLTPRRRSAGERVRFARASDRYRAVARLAYVDSDPVFTQLAIASYDRLRARVDQHDVHFTFAADSPACRD